ncbi:lymphoid organ expressed yellow head virus receptor protein, partial [Musa troglodytarum]
MRFILQLHCSRERHVSDQARCAILRIIMTQISLRARLHHGFREGREIETPTPELIDLEAKWVSEPFDLNSGGLTSPRECASPPLLPRHADRFRPFSLFRASDRTVQISILEMESGDGVEVELNKGTMEEAAEANGSTSLINKENAVTENGTHAVHADSGSEDTSKVVLDSSVDRDEGPTFATENKVTDSSKGGGSDRFKKIQKNSGRLNGDPAANHSAFTTAPSAQKTRSVNTGLVEATSNGSPVEDAHSSTPRARKNTGNGFNFKLDERAEKRKEFFMKLEEKNHAKELEKTNLQAKSKENQEAEIRRLRKSLTFKATPMPSFYQEPGPPKVELKKIPPTRARSPKLGRGKQSVAAASNPSEAGDSCQSPCVTASSTKMNDGAANSKRNAMASKNTKQKSLSKLPSQKSKTTKLDAQSLEPKVHQVKTENGDDRTTEVSAET